MIIYCLTNSLNGKRYVGQTVDTVDVRWKEHVSAAKRNSGCRILGAAIRKYGTKPFVLEVLETVQTQTEADTAEAKWIKAKKSRAPGGYNLASGGDGNGYHHEESKCLIGKTSSARLRSMSEAERISYFKNTIHKWSPERREAAARRAKSPDMRKKVAAGQKKFWSRLTREEKSRRVRHQLSGMTPEQKSARVRNAWANTSTESRARRIRKARKASAKSDHIRAKSARAWQLAQAKIRTPEQRRAIVLKAWETRRKNTQQVSS